MEDDGWVGGGPCEDRGVAGTRGDGEVGDWGGGGFAGSGHGVGAGVVFCEVEEAVVVGVVGWVGGSGEGGP